MVETTLAAEEYRALRATIRERGTARVLVVVLTFSVWAALAVAIRALAAPPLTSLASLLVLAAGFEVVVALHAGVERIGRYLQVYFETSEAGPPAWERLAMEADPTAGQRGHGSPLFAGLFDAATVLNLGLAVLNLRFGVNSIALPLEAAAVAAFHALFVVRILRARVSSARQRPADLAYFEARRLGPR